MFTLTGESLKVIPFGFDRLFPLIEFLSSENPDGFSTRRRLKSINAICSSLILGCPWGANALLNFGGCFPDANLIKCFMVFPLVFMCALFPTVNLLM